MYKSIYERYKNEEVNYLRIFKRIEEILDSEFDLYGYGYNSYKLRDLLNLKFLESEFSLEYGDFTNFCDERFAKLFDDVPNENEFLEYCEIVYNLTKEINNLDKMYLQIISHFSDESQNIVTLIEKSISKINYNFVESGNHFHLVNKDPIAEVVLNNCDNDDYVRLCVDYMALPKKQIEKRIESLSTLAIKIDDIAITYSNVELIKEIKAFYQYCRHVQTYKKKDCRKWFYDSKNISAYLDYIFHGIITIISYSISKKEISILGQDQAMHMSEDKTTTK